MKKFINNSLFLFSLLLISCTTRYPLIESGDYQNRSEQIIKIQKGKGSKRSTYFLSNNTINGVLYPILKIYPDSTAVLSSIYQNNDIKCFVALKDSGGVTIYNDTLFIELNKIKDESYKKCKRELILDGSDINF